MSAPTNAHHAAQRIAWERLWQILLAEDPPTPRPLTAASAGPADSQTAADRDKEVTPPSPALRQRRKKNAPRTSRGVGVESSPSPSKQGANDVDSVAHCVTSDASDRALGAESRPGLAGQFDVRAEVSR